MLTTQGELFPIGPRRMSRAKQICLAFNLQFQRFGTIKKRQQDEAKDAAVFTLLADVARVYKPRAKHRIYALPQGISL